MNSSNINSYVLNHALSFGVIALLLASVLAGSSALAITAFVICFLAMLMYFATVGFSYWFVRGDFKMIAEETDPVERKRLIEEFENHGFIWREDDPLSFYSIMIATEDSRDMFMSYKYRHLFIHLILGAIIMLLFAHIGYTIMGVAWFLYKFFDGVIAIALKHKIEVENI